MLLLKRVLAVPIGQAMPLLILGRRARCRERRMLPVRAVLPLLLPAAGAVGPWYAHLPVVQLLNDAAGRLYLRLGRRLVA